MTEQPSGEVVELRQQWARGVAARIQFGDERLPKRFWSKVQPCPMSGCWIWVGGHNGHRYGIVSRDGRQTLSHQWTFDVAYGAVPVGMEIDHKCNTRECCNPAHLRPLTHADNLARSNSVSSVNRRATHCPTGHEYTFENTYRNPRNGDRQCKQCRARHEAKRSAKRKAA